MATRKKRKRSKKKKTARKSAVRTTTAKSKRGRKVPAEELKLRVSVYEAQEVEGFTNAEAAKRAGAGLAAWNQWKQKYRKQIGAGPAKRGRKPGSGKAKTRAAAAPPAARGETRGRKVTADEIAKRIAVFEAQAAEGFTNDVAARRAGIGLAAWNQWKQKHRRSTGAPPSRRGRKPGRKPGTKAARMRPAAVATAPTSMPTTPAQVDEFLENARLRGRVAELEAMLAAMAHIFEQFRSR